MLHFSRLILLMAHLSFLGLQMAAWTTAVAPAPALRKHSTKCFLTLNTTSWCTVIQTAINWHLHRQIKSFSKSYSSFANMLLDLNFTTVAPGMPSCNEMSNSHGSLWQRDPMSQESLPIKKSGSCWLLFRSYMGKSARSLWILTVFSGAYLVTFHCKTGTLL